MEFRVLGPLEIRQNGHVLPCKGAKQRLLLATLLLHPNEVVSSDRLIESLALWRGPPLADLSYEQFLQPEIARLEEMRLTALEDRIDADMALGRHAALVAELEQLAAENPLRERVRGQLMLALYRTGRQAEALEVYSDTRKSLVDDLGLEPG